MMSRGRILDLKAAFDAASLQVKPSNNNTDLFDVQNEVIRWVVFNGESGKEVEIDFHLFDDLGEPTTKLTDILYVVTSDRAAKLYFEKRESSAWRDGLADFVSRVKSMIAA